jgi:AcrR family transcriptional regulator
MTRRRTRRGDETRRRILAAAKAALIEKGPAGLTLRGVAARAGVSLGNLQFHHANVDALLTALLDAEMSKAIEATAQPGEGDVVDASISMLLAQHHDAELVKLFFSLWAFALDRPRVQRVLRRFYSRFIERVAEQLRGLRGRAGSDDAEQRAWLFIALLEGASVLRTVAGKSGGAQEVALRSALRRVLLG